MNIMIVWKFLVANDIYMVQSVQKTQNLNFKNPCTKINGHAQPQLFEKHEKNVFFSKFQNFDQKIFPKNF